MLRHPDYTRARVRQLAERMKGKIYPVTKPLDELLVSDRVDRINYPEAQQLKKFRKAKFGDQFGPLWATFWFRGRATVPKEWAGRRVDLLWNSHSEATLWVEGRTIQGLNADVPGAKWNSGDRQDATLVEKSRGHEALEFQVEMACNTKFGAPGTMAHNATEPLISPFYLERAEIGAFDPEAWRLFYDFSILVDLEAEVEKGLEKSWAGELLATLNHFANIYDEADRHTWKAAGELLKPLYERHNGSRAHELSAIGHAHIDTAWLWPLAETWRKCERTFSSQTRYMTEYPEYKFACSQACQYEEMQQRNPDLYKRIKAAAKKGQWVPVGGTWIEPDCNIPSGEAMARQFLYGQRFFEREFGRRCNEFWNPDVFGYNGQLPQLMRLSGIKRFLTQKLSWNRFNKPAHHTFTWEGIDGSEVLAHFPPADTYNAQVSIRELRHNADNFKDHDRSQHSLMLFGFGDGGGGPTKSMLETLRRVGDLQGLPRTQIRSSDEFFDLLEQDVPEKERPRLIGELYFEYHRGTYTSQAAVKRGNRKSEWLLHDVEFLSTVVSSVFVAKTSVAKTQATSKGDRGSSAMRLQSPYPKEALDRLWKLVLLNQFHDILPGSSITLVYDDAAKQYAEVREGAESLRADALNQLVSTGSSGAVPVNTIGFERNEVTIGADGKPVYVEVPSYGIGRITDAPDSVQVAQPDKKNIVLENAKLRATLTTTGRLVSLIEKSTGRESIAPGGEGNLFQMFDDRSTAWDAWDVDPFHLETKKDCGPATEFKIRSRGPLRSELEFRYTVGAASTIRQVVRLDANSPRVEFHCEVEWHESHKFLKVAFPINVRALNATYEMQFGNVERPTHFNTSYDLARFEVPGHKWADLSEHGFGVALLSESKYGFSTFGNCMRMSLLRSPKYPDPQADQGRHEFAYAIMPHAGGWREGGVVAESCRFNVPVLFAKGNAEPRSFASVDDPSGNVVLETIKKAEDSDATVVRLYEAHGGRGTGRLRLNLGRPVRSAAFCNILEDELEPATISDGAIEIPYGPYQIVTLIIR